MTLRSHLCVLTGAVLLASCGSETPSEESASEADRNAQGEVQGGTISDAMIPLDRLRSQSPPLREAPARADTGRAGTNEAASEEETPEVAEEAPAAPAAEPADAPAED